MISHVGSFGWTWGRVMIGYGENSGPYEANHMVFARVEDDCPGGAIGDALLGNLL